MKFFIILLSVVMISCSPGVLTSTKNSISFEYHGILTRQANVVESAIKHCHKYGLEANLESRSISPINNWYTDIYSCK